MNLEDVHRDIEKNRKRKRLGRGVGSGHGKTCGRGHKGHKSRSGYSRKPTFQGGAMPLVRRIPKRGFNNPFAATIFALNVAELEERFEEGAEITPETLKDTGVVKARYDELKILGDGEIKKRLNVSAHRFSKSAKEKIEAAGGKVTVLVAKRTPQERVAALRQEQAQ